MSKYIISLWANHLRKGLYWLDGEDIYLADSGLQIILDSSNNYISTEAGLEFKKEVKLCDIGADDMQSLCKAIEPNLVRNQNGTNSFTFKMYYEYVDTQTGEPIKNPFLNLLVNERPVKVFWQNQWYDFVIKKCQEDSSKKSITYSCTDSFVEELSRTGFNLEFDDELENNQGRASELGARIVDGTDWKVISEGGKVLQVNNGVVEEVGDIISGLNSDLLQEELEEAVYECIVLNDFTAYNQTTRTSSQSVVSGKKVLVFYNQIQQDTLPTTVQFLYANSEEFQTESNSLIVTDADCYSVDVTWQTVVPEQGAPYHAAKIENSIIFKVYYLDISTNYRGRKLIQGIQTVYDSLTGKYCDICTVNREGDEEESEEEDTSVIYRFQATDYEEPVIVTNLLTNSQDFSNLNGWLDTRNVPSLTFQLYPGLDRGSVQSIRASCLVLDHQNSDYYIYNSGLENYSSYLKDGISVGDRLICRMRIGVPHYSLPIINIFTSAEAANNYHAPTFYIGEYDPSNHNRPLTGSSIPEYFEFDDDGWYITDSNYITRTLKCVKSISCSDIFNKHIGFFLKCSGQMSTDLYLIGIQLFKKIEINDILLTPNSINANNVVNTYYYYYDPTDQSNTKDNIHYLYKGKEPSSTYPLKRHKDSSKFRSISIKESNRFNIIQEIAEQFECWARFYTYHDPSTGEIIYDEDGRPKKYIVFKKDIGRETGLSFEYGIDLNSIRRTINSDKITTKTIVKTNHNEFAPDGFCSISRSIENYSRANYILNFDYYCSQGLINRNILIDDLYTPVNGTTEYSENHDTIGLYYWLHKFSDQYDQKQKTIVENENAKVKLEANLTVFEDYLTASQQQQQEVLNNILALSGKSTLADAQSYLATNSDNETLQNYVNLYYTLKSLASTYQTQYTQVQTALTTIDSTIAILKSDCEDALAQIELVTNAFNRKYWQYIKEGTWNSEDYVDDNLYYLDAVNVAYTAAFPQITYDIQVMRLSSLEDFKGKEFEIGDICSIIDRQYFGYMNDMITPYKEKVIVSEISYFFDEPKKDSIKVQNYKTQFEELFQRITATTQSLQYASGSYAKAAAVVNEDGTIKNDILQSSIDLNKRLVISAQNETVFWDNTGITITDATNANYKMKITSKGLLVSQDGGETYRNAITGSGINTNLLVAGTIDAGNINILDGAFATFRWDKRGLNAYDYTTDSSDNLTNLDYGKFVRFDRFGIYRIANTSSSVSEFKPLTEADIVSNENLVFSLTSSGFRLRSNDNGRFNITSASDLQVLTSQGSEMIRIGRLDNTNDPLYGIRINNSQASTVFETGSDGNVWLRDTLSVGASTNPYVKIGYGSAVRANTSYHEVISATTSAGSSTAPYFKVYEDGFVEASGVSIKGYINATGGKIGNMTINEVEQATYKVVISSSNGVLLKNSNTVLNAKLYKGNDEITSGLAYQWQKDGIDLPTATSSNLSVSLTDLSDDAASQYTCIISLNS